MATKKQVKTKSIASSGGASALPETRSESVAVKQMLSRTLTPKEAYVSNIHVRKGINGIAEQGSKMRLRLFSRNSNKEIVGGDLFNLCKQPYKYGTTSSYINATWCSYLIYGEFATWMVPGGIGKRPSNLLSLDPDRLSPWPSNARNYNDLQHWNYMDFSGLLGMGAPTFEYPTDQILHAKNFNPSDNIRGLSILLAGTHEISSNHFLNSYNTSFFQNGANSDIIVRFPKNTDKAEAKKWVDEWQLRHSIFGGNSFNIAALIGEDMQIEQTGTDAKDGQFLQLRQLNAEDIGGLLGCPPSVMGFLSRTRFDTIDVELESFAENTIMPLAEMWTQAHQTQLVDKYFRSDNTKKIDMNLSKSLTKAYEKAADINAQSDIIILLDPDSLPIMAKLTAEKLKKIGELADTLHMSISEAADYFGVELPDNPVRDVVWLPSNLVNATQSLTKEEVKVPVVPEVVQEDKQLKPESYDNLKDFYRSARKIVCDGIASNGAYDRKAIFEAVKECELSEEDMKVLVHKLFLDISRIVKMEQSEDKLRAVKDHFNSLSKTSTLRLAAAKIRCANLG